MAYVDASKRDKIKAALKQVIPAHWRYSVRVYNHSSVSLTVTQVDQAFMDGVTESDHVLEEFKNFGVFKFNHHWPKTICTGASLQLMERIVEAMNTDNYREDSEHPDTTHVGHYVDIYFGKSQEQPLKVLTDDEVQAIVKKLPGEVAERKLERMLAKVEKAGSADTPTTDKPTVDLNW